jgi:hypothetical protein
MLYLETSLIVAALSNGPATAVSLEIRRRVRAKQCCDRLI